MTDTQTHINKSKINLKEKTVHAIFFSNVCFRTGTLVVQIGLIFTVLSKLLKYLISGLTPLPLTGLVPQTLRN